jgi:hypothetical protein
MCFSAAASFTGSAVIAAIGAATLTQAKKPEQVPFAAIPFIFGIQQCAEGVLWVTLKSGTAETLQNIATYVFLITALVIWPTMIPLSMRILEKDKTRKKILSGLIAAGGLVSLFYVYCLVFMDIYPRIDILHIQYVDNFPGPFVAAAFIFYLAATILPLFVSSVKRMWLFGILISVSCGITVVFFKVYLTSVWCFFAACISIAIFWVLKGINEPEKSKTGKTHSLVYPG